MIDMQSATTVRIDIFMAGDLAQAKQVCREFCYEVGLCVHVSEKECETARSKLLGDRLHEFVHYCGEKDETYVCPDTTARNPSDIKTAECFE